MDLREKKTKRNIKNAFLELRARKELERITVKELAELAEISKATFYLHYRDIYDLSDRLEQEVIENILRSLSDPASILSAPASFTKELTLAFYNQKSLIEILFSGSRSDVLPQKIEAAVRSYLFELVPDFRDDPRRNIILTYQIKGCYYTYREYVETFGFTPVVDVICELTELLMLQGLGR